MTFGRAFLSTRALLSTVFALLVLSVVTPAMAVVSLDKVIASGITRTVSARTDAKTRLDVNYDDCIQDDAMEFELKIHGNANYNVEVWATINSQCNVDENRRDAIKGCWFVANVHPTDVSFKVDVPVRNIVGESKDVGQVVAGTTAACQNQHFTGTSVTLWFMATNGGILQGSAQTWKIDTVDLFGPEPPTGVAVAPGENQLEINWDASEGTADRLGYKIYCLPLGGPTAAAPRHFLQVPSAGGVANDSGISDAGMSIAGSGGAASTGGTASSGGNGGTGGSSGASSGGASGSTNDAGLSGSGGAATTGTDASTVGEVDPNCGVVRYLVPGQPPPTTGANGVVECGSADRLASSGVAKGLQNGVFYAVAVSSYDAVYNSGPLSNVKCEAPQLVTDFFELYRADGGKGGGGFCAFSSHAPLRSSAPALFSLTVLVGLFFARRTRASN